MRQCRGAGRVRLACWAAGSLLAAAQAWAAGPTADANTARGVLRAENEAVLASPVSERIVQMPFREGDSFKRGDTLVSFDCSQLAAELRVQTEALARRPKKKFISANTKEYVYASYMRGWSDRVQRIGNLNYPDEARRRKLYGDLLLTVGLNRDGGIKNITIIKSSGQPLLDAAAERIVRLSAPFPPLPKDVNVDELYITRTWQFLPGDVLRNK